LCLEEIVHNSIGIVCESKVCNEIRCDQKIYK